MATVRVVVTHKERIAGGRARVTLAAADNLNRGYQVVCADDSISIAAAMQALVDARKAAGVYYAGSPGETRQQFDVNA